MSTPAIVGNPLREPRIIFRRYAIIAIAAALVLALGKYTIVEETDWERMGSAAEIASTTLDFLPDLAFFPETFLPLLETLLIALWVTTLAVILAIPVAYLAPRNPPPPAWITHRLGRRPVS